jgi:hypothetical protein
MDGTVSQESLLLVYCHQTALTNPSYLGFDTVDLLKKYALSLTPVRNRKCVLPPNIPLSQLKLRASNMTLLHLKFKASNIPLLELKFKSLRLK